MHSPVVGHRTPDVTWKLPCRNCKRFPSSTSQARLFHSGNLGSAHSCSSQIPGLQSARTVCTLRQFRTSTRSGS
jgi:hypothetical protein